ncbi:MAG: hypothetical protein ACLGHJ_09775 [Gammaproteobacteria bacterium]
MKVHVRLLAAVLALLVAGCATKIPPEVVKGYQPDAYPPEDIEAWCAKKGAKESPEWVAMCIGEVAFEVNSVAFCRSCADKGGSFNTCLRTAQTLRESARETTPKGKQPAIPLSCEKTNVSCMGYPDSATERNMKASRDSRAKVDMDSYAGAYCPKKPLAH